MFNKNIIFLTFEDLQVSFLQIIDFILNTMNAYTNLKEQIYNIIIMNNFESQTLQINQQLATWT